MNVPEYLQASNEFQPIDVTVDGAVVVSGIEFGTTQIPEQDFPDSWSLATVVAGRTGVMTGSRIAGYHYVFFRYNGGVEQVIRRAEDPGSFYIVG